MQEGYLFSGTEVENYRKSFRRIRDDGMSKRIDIYRGIKTYAYDMEQRISAAVS